MKLFKKNENKPAIVDKDGKPVETKVETKEKRRLSIPAKIIIGLIAIIIGLIGWIIAHATGNGADDPGLSAHVEAVADALSGSSDE